MQVVLFLTVIIVDFSVAIIHVSVTNNCYMQVEVSASNLGVTTFTVFMQVRVSVATMQNALSVVHNCFSCKMQVTVTVIAM